MNCIVCYLNTGISLKMANWERKFQLRQTFSQPAQVNENINMENVLVALPAGNPALYISQGVHSTKCIRSVRHRPPVLSRFICVETFTAGALWKKTREMTIGDGSRYYNMTFSVYFSVFPDNPVENT